jgi:putative membrane protein
MEKNKVLKAIISASAAAILFNALPASAQTSPANDPAVNGATQAGANQSGMSGAAGATGSSAALSSADKKGLTDMAVANINEIAAGKIAVSKAQSPEVKAFAQQMIDDHSKSLTEVQTLAQARGVTLPTEPDAKHKAMAAKLDKLSGADFDKEYMKNGGLADHKMVHATLLKDEKAAKDPDVKALAAKTAPVVEQHLKAAQAIADKKM